MSDTFCYDCNSMTEVVFDHRAGDTICSECGLIVEAHTVDEAAEWRSFVDDSNDNDRNRVGGPVNPLLSEAGLSTVRPKKGCGASSEALPSSVGKWQGRASKPDCHLLDIFGAIGVMADKKVKGKRKKHFYCDCMTWVRGGRQRRKRWVWGRRKRGCGGRLELLAWVAGKGFGTRFDSILS